MQFADLLQAAFSKFGGQPKLLSPVPDSQVFDTTEQAKQQQFWDMADYKDALQSELKGAPTTNLRLAKEQVANGGWVPIQQGGVPQQGKVLGAQTTGGSDFQKLIEIARAKALESGFHPAPIVSQMASESMRGKSRFAKERNNYFGIGAFDYNLNNTHRYDKPEDSIDAYIKLISTDPRYAKAYAKRNDPKAYIQELAPTYASDPNYARTIMNTPEWRAMMQ